MSTLQKFLSGVLKCVKSKMGELPSQPKLTTVVIVV